MNVAPYLWGDIFLRWIYAIKSAHNTQLFFVIVKTYNESKVIRIIQNQKTVLSLFHTKQIGKR